MGRHGAILGTWWSVFLIASPPALLAEEVPVSLTQALDLATRGNPGILAERARADAEAARAQAVKRTAWPRLSFATGWSLTNTASMVFAQTWLVRAEERANRPDLAAWGQLQDDRNNAGGHQSGAFGVLLRWNVLDPTRGKRVAAASAEARAAELAARATADQVRLEVETAWRRAQAARERYAAAAGGAEEGREALRVVQERRQQGMATLTDELETEAASLAAELEELRAASDAALADATLLRAAGAL